ncbi:MAG: SAM-dependent methyltransferase [Sulfuricurvum sp. GWF2_44_89]|uniref:SAM-dependent methyltransferase n=2 Tax=Sulfuricurvum TaxID=286130 RepID=A0A2D3WF53_9BACT|nr:MULTISPECIES: class I SAM-dependent methyltransferase [Sulfuricurvum]OHD78211.1 MAG: SAM-dependent methyltransferase [Sulfuricurvum sp. GWF2_44_89]OHD96767.1 MAG: SAM-dependent methyltransferase [Sulfuricurvum sp. RIFOXYD2_FULL_44_160]DAB38535.1 MAG TPA: SAM-dependent methyltransferase [Sulfuricurvum kujiense]
MSLEDLHQLLLISSRDISDEYTRLFHGRGNTYNGYRFLTVDSVDKVLFAVLFEADEEEDAIISMIESFFDAEGKWEALVVQHRYLPSSPSSLITGDLPQACFAIENGLNYHVNFQSAQNIGFFPDMKIGREFIRESAKGKKVLNLFSYTCSFSVVAMQAGAKAVVNVDMNKNVLSIGRENHRLNAIDTKKVEFMPYNILKSWNRIRKSGPYDLIIIDPPSFQKGSFAATSDYEKIIRRLHEFAAEECIVLSALNAPELDCEFIKTLFKENAPEFRYVERLKNLESFPEIEEERSLKNLVFRKNF